MRCPFATWRPVANQSGPMAAHLGFVVHVQVGTGSCYGEFNNPAAQASSHFWCAADGTLEQYVDTDFIAWAEMSGNGSYISCETEGDVTTPLTGAQLKTLAHLYQWLHVVHGIAFQVCDHGGQGITTHCHYPSGDPDPAWGDHLCPGPLRLAQVPVILAMARGLDFQANKPAPAPEVPQMGLYIIACENEPTTGVVDGVAIPLTAADVQAFAAAGAPLLRVSPQAAAAAARKAGE